MRDSLKKGKPNFTPITYTKIRNAQDVLTHSNDAPMVSLRIEPMIGESQNG